MPDPDDVGRLIADFALMRDAAAAGVARDIYASGFDHWKKNVHEPVTDVDMAVNAYLEDRLRGARPDYGWLSEETVDDRSRFDARHVWVVDPIDGTRALLKGQPHFVVSVALLTDDRPVIGMVSNPVTGERFEAMAGEGATLNDAPIAVTARETLTNCRLMAYGEFLGSRRWRRPWPHVATDMVNSVAYRIVLVACGRYDGCLTVNAKSDWDLAAADLILREAGGVMTDIAGRGLAFNTPTARHEGVIAAGPALHAKMLGKMRDWPSKPRFFA